MDPALTEAEARALLAIEGGHVGDVYDLAREMDLPIPDAAALVYSLVAKGAFPGFSD